ncbi:hypothetical protein [Sphingomonas sp. LMO-1]|uniref:mannitol dehydrogenase family protein n=1 Tax=Alterirhizorhabdus profundi TaxID=2681549 RepID=UPI0018D0055D
MGGGGSLRHAAPDLRSAGVQVVDDAGSWERAKLRLLNAAHSTLAYVGLMRGDRHVDQTIADPFSRSWWTGYGTRCESACNVDPVRG